MADELDGGVAVDESPEVPEAPAPAEAPASEPTPPPEPTETPAPKEESFLDPATLPEELKPHWKRMHAAYTKNREDLKQGREAAAQIQRFYADAAYADSVVQQRASQLGYQLVRPGQAPGPPASPSGPAVPSELVQDLKTAFGPELGWMAEKMAPAMYGYMQRMLQPLQQQTQQTLQQTLQAEFEKAEQEMDSKYPGWDAKEQDLSSLLDWLQRGKPTHPVYGNRYEALYKLHDVLNGNALGTASAIGKMQQAARNKIGAGQAGPTPDVNYDDLIRKEPNRHKAFDLVVKKAEAELARKGVKV